LQSARRTVPPVGMAAEQGRYAVGMESRGSIVRVISTRDSATSGSRLPLPRPAASLAQWLVSRIPPKPAKTRRVRSARRTNWVQSEGATPVTAGLRCSPVATQRGLSRWRFMRVRSDGSAVQGDGTNMHPDHGTARARRVVWSGLYPKAVRQPLPSTQRNAALHY
jgi:hypothetical protein